MTAKEPWKPAVEDEITRAKLHLEQMMQYGFHNRDVIKAIDALIVARLKALAGQ